MPIYTSVGKIVVIHIYCQYVMHFRWLSSYQSSITGVMLLNNRQILDALDLRHCILE